MKLLMENWRDYNRRNDFNILCEDHKKGLIDDHQLVQLWEAQVNDEYQQLLNEGVVDIIKQGYEKGKELVGKAKEIYDNAVQKVSDFILKISVQAWQLIQKLKTGIAKVVSIIRKLLSFADKLCDAHPVLCKAAKILGAILVVAAVMALLTPEAQAAVKTSVPVSGVKPGILTDTEVEAIKSTIAIAAEQGGRDISPEKAQLFTDTYLWLDKVHKATEVVDISTSSEEGAKLTKMFYEMMINIVKKSDNPPAALRTMANMADDIQIWSVETSTDVVQGLNRDVTTAAYQKLQFATK